MLLVECLLEKQREDSFTAIWFVGDVWPDGYSSYKRKALQGLASPNRPQHFRAFELVVLQPLVQKLLVTLFDDEATEFK